LTPNKTYSASMVHPGLSFVLIQPGYLASKL
jgi:hypothetical protein